MNPWNYYLKIFRRGAYERVFRFEMLTVNDDHSKLKGRIDSRRKSEGLNAWDVSIVTLTEGVYELGVAIKAYYLF